MNSRKTISPIPTPAQLVLDFFDNELAGVKFPDLDQHVLQESAERVFSLADEVTRAEASLQAARDALQEGVDQLVGRCGRALAYARVYAEDDADLLRRLDAVALPKAPRPRVPERDADEAEPRPAGRRTRRQPGSGVAAPASALFAATQQDDLPI
jgi:hypothetical protein